MNQDQRLFSREQFKLLQSIWFKLLAITLPLVIVAVLIIVLIQGRMTQNSYSQSIQTVTHELVQKQGMLVAKFARSYNLPALYQKTGEESVKELERMLKIAYDQDPKTIKYLFIRDNDGMVRAQYPESIVNYATSMGRLRVVNPLSPGEAFSSQYMTVTFEEGVQTEIMDIVTFILPEREGEARQGELHVGIVPNVRVSGGLPSMWLFIGIGILAALIGAIALRYLVSSQILTPIDRLIHYVQQIAQGNMEHPLSLNVKNEIAVLGHTLVDMAEQLKGMVQTEAEANRTQGQIMNMLSTVSAAADGNLTVEAEVTADALGSLADAFNMMVASLASLVDQVRRSAADMSRATNEILASSAQMIKGAEEQQNHINNITSAVDEIAVSMQQVANNAEAAARASQKATEAAQKGESSVEETIRGMHRIRNTVQVTSKKIKSLGDRSIEIGEIITTIDDIARQTTILALNAAIEAARAGEHGRGFGVVAEEVRKLAERSSKATQDIADLIKGIQAETNEAVRTMEEGTREVEEGTRLADVAGSSLKEIDKSVGQVANLIQEISLAAKQQARGTDGVVRSMETISDITTLHAEGVRKTTKTIEQLATLSARLIEAIGNFKIAETDVRAELPKPKKPLAPKPQPQPQPMAPFVQQPQDLAEFSRQFGSAEGEEDEDELITEEDFFKAP
ncbi:methyl-accepting chemotaxis sensory transducer [Candidatus Vecturithrix granuli]|uniref:Methyl-accepting chemotaxis sensory transducer n=1 Tax=Vecturithrix granuli TaxID=1499967 RepID=A0A0S6W9I7_VECG1|nr:methyl-accepting chemotaxis sensory transducer [Candidatus Vecturithrix granuli]